MSNPTDRPQKPRECRYHKKAPWWNPFKPWDDCTHPETVERHCGENGICYFRSCQYVCSDFTPKTKDK